MNARFSGRRHRAQFFLIFLLTLSGFSQTAVTNDPAYYGPYNAVILPGGDGLHKQLAKDDSVLRADSPWTMYAWINLAEAPSAPALIAGLGDPQEEYPRYFAIDGGHVVLWLGKDNSISSSAALQPGKWQFLAATFDGKQFTLYSDGAQAATGTLDLGSVSPDLHFGPPVPPGATWQHFGGSIASLTILRRSMSADEVKQLAQSPEDFSQIEFEEGSKPWPVQTRGQAGYRAPQDPSTLPHSRAPFSKPVAKPLHPEEIVQANGNAQRTRRTTEKNH